MTPLRMEITTEEGEHYKGTAPQLVGFLWHARFITESTVDSYMAAVARRLAALGEEPPRTDSAVHFLEDLATLKTITITWRSDGQET